MLIVLETMLITRPKERKSQIMNNGCDVVKAKMRN